jgi:O-antigen/teichoic acid export membrane protein
LTQARSEVGRQTLDGAVRVFIAEALILPTGLITTIFLTHRLGGAGYGLFTLAAMLVAWIEWSLTSVFARAAIKFTAEAGDGWRPVGTAVLRVYLWTSCAAAGLLIIAADAVATAFHEPVMASYLRLFALDIPIFGLSQAHRHILIGLGGYRQRALGAAARWTVRLVLIVLLVELGMSIRGAILGSIGASLVELAVHRWFARVPLLGRSSFPMRQLWGYAVPLFSMALSLRLLEKLDLLMLKLLGGSAEQSGWYGAAQNLAIIPGILAGSFSPLLFSSLTRVLRDGDVAHARDMARDSMRGGLLLLPAAGMTAAAAHEIIGLIFPPDFAPASGPLAILTFAALGMLIISIATTVLIAAGRPGWTFALTGPLIPLALVGHLLIIPRLGVNGAAGVTTAVVCAGALATVLAVQRVWRVLLPMGSLVRSLALTACAYVLAATWPAPGAWLLLKLLAVCLLVPVAYLLLGEFDAREIGLARSLVHCWPLPGRSKAGEAP